MLSEQLKDLQLSIYDFLQEEKSQEVAPSETLPQVDETQESEKLPSSDLDTRKNWEIVQDSLNEFFEKPTEDTDNKPLFSVGDTVKVRQAKELYSADVDPESFYYLKELEGETLTVTYVGDKYIVADDSTLYKKEVIKI